MKIDGEPGTEGYFSFSERTAGLPPLSEVDEKDLRRFWPSGPWDDEPDEWVGPADYLSGVSTYARRHDVHGHWCGYAVVPRRHPAFGFEMEHVDVTCHWGLSFAGPPHWVSTPDPDVWALGFDCGHAWDIQPGTLALYQLMRTPSAESLFTEAMAGLDWSKEAHGAFTPRYRSLRYVERELTHLLGQLTHKVEVPHGRKRVRQIRIPGISRAFEDVTYSGKKSARVPRGPWPLSVKYVHR